MLVRLVGLGFVVVLLAAAPVTAARADSPAAMKHIVRQWSSRLNAYDNDGVAHLFARPAGIVQSGTILRMESYSQLAEWHSGLPCAGTITSMRVKGIYVTAVFTLTRGPHRPCPAAGQQAAAMFSVVHGKITGWAQVPVPEYALHPHPVA